jgi:hypothetical protein
MRSKHSTSHVEATVVNDAISTEYYWSAPGRFAVVKDDSFTGRLEIKFVRGALKYGVASLEDC